MNKLAVAALTAGGLAVSMTGLADGPVANPYMDDQNWASCNDTNRYGYDVRTIQEQLLCLGYNPGPVDGCYGSLTRGAVKEFQSANGLSRDGVVGNQTGSALAAAYERCITPPPQPVKVITPKPVVPFHTHEAPKPPPPPVIDGGNATLSYFIEGGYAADLTDDPVDLTANDDIYLGDGAYINTGLVIGHTKSALSAMMSIGYKYNEESYNNGLLGDADAEFSTIPLNFVVFYNWNRARLGLGVTYKINPDLELSTNTSNGMGSINGERQYNDNESGPMARFDYFVTRGLYLGAVIEAIEYGGRDADNAGLHLGYEF